MLHPYLYVPYVQRIDARSLKVALPYGCPPSYAGVCTPCQTIPCLAGHDGDKAFLNLLFEDLESLLDIDDVTGHKYRPTEQAPVEREHQEAQRSLGMLLQEVVRCMPGEWGQCVPIVEWIRYNTPSRCGITPRDLDKGWSIVSPLERDLLPFEPARAETVSETARTQFDAFRKVRTVMLQYKIKEGRRRAELANRVRTAGCQPRVTW